MARATSTLLLVAGATLLVIWWGSPARSAPPPDTPTAPTVLDRAAVVLSDVKAQAARLGERLPAPRKYPSPVRNPFTFGDRSAPTTRSGASAPVVAPEPSAPVAPVLVAILTSGGATTTAHRAVLSMPGDADVQFVVEGQTIGDYVVSTIDAAGVVLTARDGARRVRLSLQ
jgi:hypothetical protein